MLQKRDEKTIYFAHLPDEKVGDALWEKKRDYERFLKSSCLFEVYRKMHWRYYGQDDEGFTAHEVGQDGGLGELHRLKLNHHRSIITSWLNMVQTTRPAVVPVAINDDYESELEVKRAKALIDHERGPSGAQLEAREAEALEYAGLYGHSVLLQLWNSGLGEVLMPTAGAAGMELEPELDLAAPVRAGKLQAFALSPLDFFFDPFRKNADFPWIICRLWACREDLVTRFPEFEEQILKLSGGPEPEGINLDFSFGRGADTGHVRSRDEVPLYVFLHEKTEAVEDGKQILFLDAKTVLQTGPLGYKRMPVRRLAAATVDRTAFGFSPAWDLLAPQEAHDSLSTIALTNARTYGLGSMITPKDSDVQREQLGEGLMLLEYTQGMEPPKPIEFPRTPQEVFSFRRETAAEMGTLLGVNSVVRGDPEASLKSGSALALVQAQGVQFSSAFQANVIRFIEGHSLDTVEICQRYMRDERQFEIVGTHVASLTLPFTGEQLKRITKVRVQVVNPMSKTLAGRVQMADTLAERFGNVLTPGDYFRVLETGTLEHLTRPVEQKAACIDRENELLAQGFGPIPQVEVTDPLTGEPVVDPMTGEPQRRAEREPGRRYVVALITDDHRAHVKGHLEPINNPAVRESEDPAAQAIIKATLDHIDEHEKLLATMTLQRPGLLELTGQEPLQSALPPALPAPGDEPARPGGGGDKTPPGGSKQPSAAQPLQPTPAGQNEQPRMPQMPVNPSTGQRAEPPGPP
jgi:hypothetical protein